MKTSTHEIDPRFAAAHYQDGRDLFVVGGGDGGIVGTPAVAPDAARPMSTDEFLRDALAELPPRSAVAVRIRSHLAGVEGKSNG
jgi:hypothetical protein